MIIYIGLYCNSKIDTEVFDEQMKHDRIIKGKLMNSGRVETGQDPTHWPCVAHPVCTMFFQGFGI